LQDWFRRRGLHNVKSARRDWRGHVLCICAPEYVQNFNAGAEGVETLTVRPTRREMIMIIRSDRRPEGRPTKFSQSPSRLRGALIQQLDADGRMVLVGYTPLILFSCDRCFTIGVQVCRTAFSRGDTRSVVLGLRRK